LVLFAIALLRITSNLFLADWLWRRVLFCSTFPSVPVYIFTWWWSKCTTETCSRD